MRPMLRAIAAAGLAGLAGAGGCASRPAGVLSTDAPAPGSAAPSPAPDVAPGAAPAAPGEPAAAAGEGLREAFPHVRIDAAARLVEFDGFVPITTADPQTPVVYLEVVACTPDTRPHESLVASEARPSHVHAALLAIGLEPGSPGEAALVDGTLRRRPPRGSPVGVTLAYRDGSGAEVEVPPAAWIVHQTSGARLGEGPAGGGAAWVFAGSRMVRRQGREFYDADGSGVIVGLHTFGAEVVALEGVMSPEAALEEPVWIADARAVPPMGTAVVVRLRAR